jgi:pimeloyl-ACP methyl ester carboxylesterase
MRFIVGLLTTLVSALPPDAFKTLAQVAEENGFSSQSYSVVTDDGYILNLSRIPGKKGETSSGKPVALFMHA